ncbi:O-antigen ligase family protein [Bacillus spongiae]|uniref:O-antigen ligase family protein n=1 Tax=Bacillus spongiae TaxID=2683610 RepID=A0ABU8HEH8_9BACI
MDTLKKYSLLVMILSISISILVSSSFFGFIVTLIIILLTFVNSKHGLYFLFFFFPIRPFLIEINSGLKYAGDFVILTLLFFALYSLRKKPLTHLNQYLLFIPFLLFLLIGSISAILSEVSFVAIIFELRALLITFFLVFIFSTMTLSERDKHGLMWLSILMGTFLALHGLIEKISHRTILLPEAWINWELSSVNIMRIYGLTGNPNVLGTFLLIVFFITLFAMNVYKKYTFVLLCLAGLLLGTTLLTYSRGSILAFTIAGLLFIVLSKDWNVFRNALLSILIGSLLIYYPVNTLVTPKLTNVNNSEQTEKKPLKTGNELTKDDNGGFLQRFTQVFSEDIINKSSEWGRLFLVFKGLEIFTDHPVIGTGFATYGDSATLAYGSPIYDQYDLPQESGMYTDNQYIQLLVQTGIIGSLFFVVFILLLFQQFRRRKSEKIAHVMFALLLCSTILALFYNILEEKIFTLYFYSAVGLFMKENKEP